MANDEYMPNDTKYYATDYLCQSQISSYWESLNFDDKINNINKYRWTTYESI